LQHARGRLYGKRLRLSRSIPTGVLLSAIALLTATILGFEADQFAPFLVGATVLAPAVRDALEAAAAGNHAAARERQLRRILGRVALAGDRPREFAGAVLVRDAQGEQEAFRRSALRGRALARGRDRFVAERAVAVTHEDESIASRGRRCALHALAREHDSQTEQQGGGGECQ